MVVVNNDAEPLRFPSTFAGLKAIYRSKIEPVEVCSGFEHFYTPRLNDRDLDAKPMVLLIGQYSTGKTTFINHLLGGTYPGSHIGPEPTTDKFVAVLRSDTERILPGNAATVQADLPFSSLAHFGAAFLAKFQVSFSRSDLAESVTLIDTPGILSGDKQRLGRAYDFVKVIEWFAQRADLILLLFDAHKLDISDEFKDIIQSLRGQDDKIRVVLNKADSITQQQLMRVYGALMWSLGKVINTPEVVRVYVGSFGDAGAQYNRELIECEHRDLLKDLFALPSQSAVRKVNELVKRARMARVHALIIDALKRELPAFFGRAAKQTRLVQNLAAEFTKVQKAFNLPPGDFPDVEQFQRQLKDIDLSTFPKLPTRLLAGLDDALQRDLPHLLAAVAADEDAFTAGAGRNPFNSQPLQALDPADPDIWVIRNDARRRYATLYRAQARRGPVLTGDRARPFLSQSGLDAAELAKVWSLADADQDGALTETEFAVAMHLITLRLQGVALPSSVNVK